MGCTLVKLGTSALPFVPGATLQAFPKTPDFLGLLKQITSKFRNHVATEKRLLVKNDEVAVSLLVNDACRKSIESRCSVGECEITRFGHV